MALWPARYGAEHPVDVRFAPTEAERRHKSGASASRYANTGQDCESAQHGAIRQASYILLYVNDPSCLRIYSM